MTLENQAKAQHTFDVVAAHLLTQNQPSKMWNGTTCAYRSTGGLRCAVGFCIPDKNYSIDLEGCSLSTSYGHLPLMETQLAIVAAIDPQYCNDPEFLSGLQMIHDGANPVNWPDMLRVFACNRKLDSSIVTTMEQAAVPQPQELVHA